MATTHTAYARIRQHTLGDTLREQARSRPQMPAAIDGDVRLTYLQLDRRVNQLAAALRGHGVTQGSRMLWMAQNSFRLLELLLAAAKLGAVVCPANWRVSQAEGKMVLEDFDPCVVFWQGGEVGELSQSLRQSDSAKRLWIQQDSLSANEGYEALLAGQSTADVDVEIDGDLPLLAVYTAAFDGRPNAALLSHTTLLLQGLISMQGQLVDEKSVYLASGPMFHVGVMMGVLGTFIAGGCNIFVARVQAAELLALIANEKASHGYIAQPTIEQMRALNADGRHDLSSLFAKPDMSDWRMPLVMPAAAPLMKTMGGYGQTEIGGLSVMVWLGGSGAGRPSPFVQVKVVDGNGEECPPGQTGEIVVRGAMVMCGYHNRPEENAARTDLGWHRTHDLGLRKEDGSLVFVGPKTTMIKSGVENIYPAEVESCLRSHPDVQDVCVIGVPDPTWQQNVKAVVVARAGKQPTAESLIEHCRERIASYKKPKHVTFVDSLPRTGAGMLDRTAVDAAHGGGGYPKVG